MICPLCGYSQPGYARECLQCHTPVSQPSDEANLDQEEAEQTDTNVRVERRRKARERDNRPVDKERIRVPHRQEDASSEPSESPRPVKPPPPVKPLPAPPSIAAKRRTSPEVRARAPELSHSSGDSSRDESSPPPAKAVHSNGSPSAPQETPSQSGEHLNHLVDRLKRVIVSTTPEVQGRPVKEYKGIVSTGSVVKLDGWASYLEGVKDIGSLRHAPFDAQIRKARDVLITDLKIEAAKLGANGVVGMTVQLHPVQQGAADRLLWLVAIGTAVVLPE